MEEIPRLNTPVPLENSFDATVGIEYLTIDPAEVVVSLEVRDDLLNENGCLHGGVYATLAEAMASIGTLAGVLEEGKVAMGMSVHSLVLRDVVDGLLEVRANRIGQEPDRWTWQVESRQPGGELCALGTVTVAVRANPSGRPDGR
jgi:1,4-dihydroxy-2-naphthoyl-CoA hydrolase